MMLLLSLLGLFASLTIANIERSCNCIDDACVNARGKPPYNTSVSTTTEERKILILLEAKD